VLLRKIIDLFTVLDPTFYFLKDSSNPFLPLSIWTQSKVLWLPFQSCSQAHCWHSSTASLRSDSDSVIPMILVLQIFGHWYSFLACNHSFFVKGRGLIFLSEYAVKNHLYINTWFQLIAFETNHWMLKLSLEYLYGQLQYIRVDYQCILLILVVAR